MNASPQLLVFLEKWEGRSLTRYLDSAGKPTIGVGHLLASDDPRETITAEEADALLQTDVGVKAIAVDHMLARPVTPTQFDALVSFAFNLGAAALRDSTLLRLVNIGQPEAASFEFARWNHVRVNGELKAQTGLTRRREAERVLFVDGVYTFP